MQKNTDLALTLAAPQTLDDVSAHFLSAIEDLPRIPRQHRSREKRAELLRVAAELFVAHGFGMTTADEIAMAAGYSVGTFYNYFRNKRQILLVLIWERLNKIFTHMHLASLNFETRDQRRAIHSSVQLALGEHTENGLKRVWQELVLHDQDLAPFQAIIRNYTISNLEEHITLAIRLGETAPNLDPHMTAVTLYALFEGLAMQPPCPEEQERLIETVTDMVYRMLYKQPC